MHPDDIPEPHRPLQHLVEDLRTTLYLARTRDELVLRGEIAPVLVQLFFVHQQAQSDTGGVTVGEQLDAFCDHLEALTTASPDPTTLAGAPHLDRWCALVSDCAQLAGRVTGHPRLREGARITTSPLLRIDPHAGWARTWSRYYRLGRQDPTFLYELMADGRLPPSVQRLRVL